MPRKPKKPIVTAICLLILSGCSTNLLNLCPTPEQSLLVPAEDLPKLEGAGKRHKNLSKVREIDLINYTALVIKQYNLLKIKFNTLVQWHKKVRK